MQGMVLPVTVVMAVSSAVMATIRTMFRSFITAPAKRRSNFEFIFLGTGVSTGIPRISCIIDRSTECKICNDAHINPLGKNRRCNVSGIVRVGDCCILLDCGKTAREAILRWGPKYGIEAIDAVVLTHGHADAVLGLDDLRDMQKQVFKYDEKGTRLGPVAPKSTLVYLNEQTMADCKRVFPYLMPEDDSSLNLVKRRVSKVVWKPFKKEEFFQPLYPVDGVDVRFIPVPLWHGNQYVSMGYIIHGPSESNVAIAYLSDVSEVPEETMDFLRALEKIDMLVVDALQQRSHISHYSLDDAIKLARELKPGRTLLVGMSCDMGLHEDVSEQLVELKESDNIDVALAYDGLRIPF